MVRCVVVCAHQRKKQQGFIFKVFQNHSVPEMRSSLVRTVDRYCRLTVSVEHLVIRCKIYDGQVLQQNRRHT